MIRVRWFSMILLPAMLLASRAADAQAKPGAKATTSSAAAPAKGPAEPTAEEKAKAQARKYLLFGNRNAAAGEWDDAFAEHTIAWRLHQDWEIAGALGKSAHRTKHHAIAILRLTYHLASAPAGRISPQDRAKLQQWIEESKKQVGFLAIAASPGAEILVDGDFVGKAPLPEPIPADPGKHEIQAQTTSATQKTTVTTVLGKTSAVTLTNETPANADRTGASPSALRVAGLAGGAALFAGGIVVGGAFASIASEHGARKQEAAGSLDGRDTMQEAARAEAEAKNIAFWGFVGAAVAAAGTTTFYLKTRTPGGTTVTGAAGVRSGGPFLSIQGEF